MRRYCKELEGKERLNEQLLLFYSEVSLLNLASLPDFSITTNHSIHPIVRAYLRS
jgi:hypothetical protein